MPPVMGAAAFLMVEYTDTPYVDVVRHAILPAVITYIALFYIVHLEAVKQNLPSLPRAMTPKPRLWALVPPLATLGVLAAIAGVLYAVFVLWFAVESNAARLGIVVLPFLVQIAVYHGFSDRQRVVMGQSVSVRV